MKHILSKTLFALFALAWLVTLAPGALAQEVDNDSTVSAATENARGWIAVGAGLATGLAGIGSGLGESNIGAAAVGAMAEDPKLFGRGLIMTVLPETIVIFGLVVSLLLIFVF